MFGKQKFERGNMKSKECFLGLVNIYKTNGGGFNSRLCKESGFVFGRFLIYASIVVVLYFLSVFVRAEISERRAEVVAKEILFDISRPWSAKRIRFHGSHWLNNDANLTPEQLAVLAEKDLGSMKVVIDDPKCKFQNGHEKSSLEKKTWAICVAKVRFEKNVAVLEFRLISQDAASMFSLAENLQLNDFVRISIVN